MQIREYLDRIKFHGPIRVDNETLFGLHEHHVMNVPFENLDVYYGRMFDLDLGNTFKKVVGSKRGGFCYELNYLFCELLKSLGFNARIISARIYTDNGLPGPEFDHMSVYVKTDKEFLLDVGFGDLFLLPVEIKPGVQTDGRNEFKIELREDDCHDLLMSSKGMAFQKKYVFSLGDVLIDDFIDSCHDKQVNPESYFVKNTICSKPTRDGRITIFNNKFVETKLNGAVDSSLLTKEDLPGYLESKFDIVIK